MDVIRMMPRPVFRAFIELWYISSRIYFFSVNFLFATYHFLFTRRTILPPPTNDLLRISATQAAEMIRSKDISSVELITAYINRIQEVNPIINAVAQDNFAVALKRAREVDVEIARSSAAELAEIEQQRPLLGVPFTIKDCMEVEGMLCTYGVHYRRDTVAKKNATVVDRMFASGAILLAITNVPEVCMWWEAVNTIYGRTRNPYDTRRTSGGSSGGEGALVAAAGSLVGVGSDIGGSIRMPSFFNGVFGLKPSPGTIPLDGHLPPVHGYRTEMLRIGPICRYAADLPLLYKVMGSTATDALKIDEPIPMNKLRVFYMEGLRHPLIEGTNSEMMGALNRSVRYLELKYDLAAVRVDFPFAHQILSYFFLSMEGSKGDPKFVEIIANYQGRVNCVTEFFRWLVGMSVHTFPAILVGFLEGLHRNPEEKKKRLLYKRDRLIREVKDLLGDDGVLIFPSFPTTAPYHNQPVLTPFNFGYTGLFNTLALPVAQCPMGPGSNGMPLGVQIVGGPKSERNLIAIAKDLEEGFGGWRVPT